MLTLLANTKTIPSNLRICLSQLGLIVKFASCSTVWSSKLQTTIALLTTKAEYMASSVVATEVLILHNFTEELHCHDLTRFEL